MTGDGRRWATRVAGLILPRPYLLQVEGINSGPTEISLMKAYPQAAERLCAVDEDDVIRWEALGAYAAELEKYATVLGTFAATADATFLTPTIYIDRRHRQRVVEQMLRNDDTRCHGMAAALSNATSIASLAVAVAAFAVKEPSQNSYDDAASALCNAETRLDAFRRTRPETVIPPSTTGERS